MVENMRRGGRNLSLVITCEQSPMKSTYTPVNETGWFKFRWQYGFIVVTYAVNKSKVNL
jgi:hypothetical protein